jgi:acyl carrier protein
MLEFGSSPHEAPVDTVGELVREITAEVLRDFKPGARWSVDPVRSFRDQGLDSLARVELRVRLAARTGLDLPANLTVEYPSPSAVAGYLQERLTAP